jgi:lipopolysaccharide export system permease protein
LGAALTIIDRYVLREVLWSWLAVTGVLSAVLVANQLAQILGQAAARGYPQAVILHLIGLMSVQNFTVIVPVGLLLGLVLALGRLHHENEMAALNACGVGPTRLLWSVGLLAVGVTLGLSWLTLWVAPQAFSQVEDIRRQALRAAQFGQLEPGKFHTLARGTVAFYAESADADGVLRHVFVERHVGPSVQVVLAERAVQRIEQEGNLHVLVLYDGDRYEATPGQASIRQVHFAEHGIPVAVSAQVATSTRVEARSTGDLFRDSSPKAQAELQWRLSLPVMTLILALLAIPLAVLQPRQGRYARLGTVILLYFVYSNLVSAARTWLEKGWLPPIIGLWWVHIVVLLLAWFMWRPSLVGRRVSA